MPPASDHSADRRLPVIDLARTLALCGMVIFHFVRDLEMFGLAAPGTTTTGGWSIFARLIAGSFLFLAGVSLALAHQRAFHAGAFFRRLAMVAAAAALVSVATYLAMPGVFIYFGILHSIALSSVIALPFVWLPSWVSAAAALAIWIVSATHPALFDSPWAAFTGLSSMERPSLDFLPVFPWLAPVLLGISAATAVDLRRWLGKPRFQSHWITALGWPGRHSLAVYLIHQPVLLAIIWLAVQVM